MTDPVDPAPLTFEQKIALHQLWMARVDARRRELLALTGATSALLVAIPLVGSHVSVGSPTAIYMLGTMVMLFGLFLAATITGSDLGTLTRDYGADERISDDRIPRVGLAWRRQIMALAVGTMVLFGLCFLALAAVSDDLRRERGNASPAKASEQLLPQSSELRHMDR